MCLPLLFHRKTHATICNSCKERRALNARFLSHFATGQLAVKKLSCDMKGVRAEASCRSWIAAVRCYPELRARPDLQCRRPLPPCRTSGTTTWVGLTASGGYRIVNAPFRAF